MKTIAQKFFGLLCSFAAVGSTPLLGQSIQVGDLRLPAETYAENFFFFDNGFSAETREVVDSPVLLPTTFSGITQRGENPAGNRMFDFIIRNFGVSSTILNLNRFVADGDGPVPNEDGEILEEGALKVGGYQFAVDLEPIETFLSENGETLTALNLRALFNVSNNAPVFDLYLSYTDPSGELALTPLSTDPAEIYSNLWLPAQTLAEGDVVNGTHRILRLQTSGNQDFSEDILPLYQAGVRQVNLVVVSGGFYANNRQFVILDGAGVEVGTDVNPEPELSGDFRLDRAQFGNVATPFDQIIDSATREVAGLVSTPVLFTGISQNPEGNEVSRVDGLALWDIDGIDGNAGSEVQESRNATVRGFGVDGIQAANSDAFQYTAWQSSGDFDVSVTLQDLFSVNDENGQAGLMVRAGNAVDAAHVFIGVRNNGNAFEGDLVVVVRDEDGGLAVETLGGNVTFPIGLRIQKTGDTFDLFVRRDDDPMPEFVPAVVPNVNLVLEEPSLVGLACTSGSDQDESLATFVDSSVVLPDPTSDIGLQTTPELTTLRQLNRFLSETEAGMVQWSIDLSPLEAYLNDNAIDPSSIDLRLLADVSPNGEEIPLDVYLSYENPAESITLAGLTETLASNVNLASLNFQNFFAPAIGAEVGDIVNGTHRVLRAAEAGDIDLSEDLLALFQSGVREFNLILATDRFFQNRDISILEGSGVFVQTPGGDVTGPAVSASNLDGNVLSLTVDNLTPGEVYHVSSSANLMDFAAIEGSEMTAGDTTETVSVTVDLVADPTQFLIVVEGTIPQ